MNQNIILRSKPGLEISFAENGFEVIDESAPNNNGIYSYDNLKLVELKNAWFMSMVQIVRYNTWILNLVPFGPQIKDKAHLKIILDEKTLKLWLFNSDMEKAKAVKQLFNEKTPAAGECL